MAMNCGAAFAWPLADPVKYKQKNKQIKCGMKRFLAKGKWLGKPVYGIEMEIDFPSRSFDASSKNQKGEKYEIIARVASEMRFFGIRLDRIESVCVCTLVPPDKTRRWKTLFTLHTTTHACKWAFVEFSPPATKFVAF